MTTFRTLSNVLLQNKTISGVTAANLVLISRMYICKICRY